MTFVKGQISLNKGKTTPLAVRLKISLSRKGQKNSLGRIMSEETKRKVTRLGTFHTEESKTKMRLSQKGKHSGILSPWWQGGKTKESRRIKNTLEYKQWRKQVFERDNYICLFCGARNGLGKQVELNADHIKPFCKYPELRLLLSNGRTLCRPCHAKTDTFGLNAKCQ